MEHRDGDYLVYCAEGFLEALEEARALASTGEVGISQLDEKLHFAIDLLDIMDGDLRRHNSGPESLDHISYARDLLLGVRAGLPPVTIH